MDAATEQEVRGVSEMSIAVKLLSGEHAGKTAVMPGSVNPMELLGGLGRAGTKWVVDFTNATSDEALDWGGADMMGRVLAALSHGRRVRFQDDVWNPVQDSEILTKAVGEIQDAIASSGMTVCVDIDDDSGVTIGVQGSEHEVQ
jgi:hypothetical protein